MVNLVFIATGWGPVFGGINSFNYDICISLAKLSHEPVMKYDYQVICLCPDITAEICSEAKLNGLILCNVNVNDIDNADALISTLKNCGVDTADSDALVWFGHDIKTGVTAKTCAGLTKSKAAVFHHMDYEAYYNLANDAVSAQNKEKGQLSLFKDLDIIFPIGPLLEKSVKDILLKNEVKIPVFQLIPGLCESVKPLKESPQRKAVITFGRIEENDIIKQTKLALSAYCRNIKNEFIDTESSQFYMIGLDPEDKKAEKDIKADSKKQAGKAVNVKPLPYNKDRKDLFATLRSCSVCMMLSLHEGFGLVGFEAIAAGVPLILSKNSGLYLFLKNQKLDCFVTAIKITDTKNDIAAVAAKMHDILSDDNSKDHAIKLLESLRAKNFTWQNTATHILQALSHINILKNNIIPGKDIKAKGLIALENSLTNYKKIKPV